MTEVICEALNEEKQVELLPQHPCLYGVRCNELKDRDKQERAISQIARKEY